MESAWKNSINKQRTELYQSLYKPLHLIADKCVSVWQDRDKLNNKLIKEFALVPNCSYLYVLQANGLQISDNVDKNGIIDGHYARDRSNRPYMKEKVPSEGFLLSDAYISLKAHRPSLTAIQVIKDENTTLGFLGADFDLRDLPEITKLYQEPKKWRQIKGDPSIRSTVFQQSRIESVLDKNSEQVFSILEELLTERGMFQGVIHFSSSRATIWVMDDPYRYRILDQEALLDTDICLAYPLYTYPEDALIPKDIIPLILKNMQKLRIADDTFYLRSASINIFNGLISLTFSCDGSHYMPYHEFIEKDASFWGG
ncbi:MAG: PDC sensor domain-containing protein [Pseudomonadota bacterium]